MNKIIVLSVLCVLANLAAIARAQADTVVAEVRSVSETIQTIQMSNTGSLNIIDKNNASVILPLSPANSAKLLSAVQELNGTQISVTHRKFVCMMMANPDTAQELYIGNGSETDLKMILSQDSCALHDFSAPTDPALDKIAQDLRSQMVVLAEQLTQ